MLIKVYGGTKNKIQNTIVPEYSKCLKENENENTLQKMDTMEVCFNLSIYVSNSNHVFGRAI